MLLISTNKLIAIVGCPFMLNMAINAYFYKEYVRTITELQATISKILDVQDKLLQKILEQESIIRKINADILLNPNPVVDPSIDWAGVGQWAVIVILCLGIVGLSWAAYDHIGDVASRVVGESFREAAPVVSKIHHMNNTMDTFSANLEEASESLMLVAIRLSKVDKSLEALVQSGSLLEIRSSQIEASIRLISESSILLGIKVAEIECKIAEILARLPAENNMPVVEAPADAVLETVTHIVDTVVTRGLS